METNEHFPLLEATRAFLAKPKKMLIGAEWRDAASGRQLDVVNPADGTVLAHVPEADEHDVQQAVAARAHSTRGRGAPRRPPIANACCSRSPTKRMRASWRRSSRSTTASP